MEHLNATIDALWIYPIKSLGGISLDRAALTPEGLAYDRRWMIIDDKGHFVSQRGRPEMAGFKVAFRHGTPSDALTIQAPNSEHCDLSPDDCDTRGSVRVWKSDCDALLAKPTINQWLSHHLNAERPLRLVYIDPCFRRPLDSARFSTHSTGFADAAPLLITNTSSLDALNFSLTQAGITSPLTMQRFRPNIVLSGIPAFTEHAITSLRSGLVNIQLVDHCQRCSMITIEPQSCEMQDTTVIFQTLAKLNPMPDKPKAPAFGVNAVVGGLFNGELKRGSNVKLAHKSK